MNTIEYNYTKILKRFNKKFFYVTPAFKENPASSQMLTFSRKHAFWAHAVASGKTVACTGNHPLVAYDTLII